VQSDNQNTLLLNAEKQKGTGFWPVPKLCPKCARQGQKFQNISKQIQKANKFLPSNQLVKNTQLSELIE
jgi:hypothetical protein